MNKIAKKALQILLFLIGATLLILSAYILVKSLKLVPLSPFDGSFNPIWLCAILGIWAAVIYMICAILARLLWKYGLETSELVGFEMKTIGLTLFGIVCQIPFALFANSSMMWYIIAGQAASGISPAVYVLVTLLYYLCGAVGGLGLCLFVIATLANCIKLMGKKGAE